MNEMTFEEIKANQGDFLRKYAVFDLFESCGIKWNDLIEIGDDYEQKCYGEGRENKQYRGEYFDIIQRHITKIASFDNVHSYRFRIKKTASLLAKIIRKAAERQECYDANNYYKKITDLLGLRILYVFKDDYLSVHEQIMSEYSSQLSENIVIKLKKGDDKEMYSQLVNKHSNVSVDENKMYRSIHYTIYADKNNIDKNPKVEIQTRTIFEEGWSEINHKLIYKRGVLDHEINRISDVLSSMVGACDTIGSLMLKINDLEKSHGERVSTTGDNTVTENDDNVVKLLRDFLLSP